jgi:hypothetical protein
MRSTSGDDRFYTAARRELAWTISTMVEATQISIASGARAANV